MYTPYRVDYYCFALPYPEHLYQLAYICRLYSAQASFPNLSNDTCISVEYNQFKIMFLGNVELSLFILIDFNYFTVDLLLNLIFKIR